MKYAMILVGDESKWDAPDLPENLMDEIGTWWEKWHQAGKVLEGGAELAPSHTAKTVGPGDGGAVVTDGPFVELKEVVGGFILMECDDIDEAVAIASGWPPIAAIGDRVEVRPFMER